MLIGHKTQWQFLRKSVELEKLPHAFLFQGPAKVGKRTFALELAKLLNCQNPDFQKRPCQTCFACCSLEKQNLPDLIFIAPLKKEISIGQIRDLNWNMLLSAHGSSWKVAILDKAHCLGKEAQNCFLKTLEEPKPKRLFILVTEYPARLLPTVLSRVQEIRFSKVPSEKIHNYLKEKGIDEARAKKIVRFSAGRPGQAIDFLESPGKLKFFEGKIKEIKDLSRKDLNYKFQYAKKLSESSSQELNQIFEIWLQHFHLLFLAKAGLDPVPKKNLKALEKTQILINFTNINQKLALENLMLQLRAWDLQLGT